MKKVFIVAFLLTGLAGFSQVPPQHPHHRMKGMDLNPEQRATLSSKKLALALDLDEQQQKKVMALQIKRAEEHKALWEQYRKDGETEKPAPTPEDRFKRMNDRLDRQLAYKAEMRKILSDAQYEKWNQMAGHMRKSYRQGRDHHDHHSRR